MNTGRLWSKIAVRSPDECWPWHGATNDGGYGIVRWDGRTMLAHRVVYQVATGVAPSERRVCHTCDCPPCCNPAHFFLGTQADNVRDCVAKGRFKSNVGVDHPRATLTEADVLEIRRMRAAGVSGVEIGRRFGITRFHAWEVYSRRRWTHVSEGAAA